MVRIVLKFNDTVLKEIESDHDEITIGRDADNDIQIENVAVSRKHARIRKAPNYYYIEDLNSTNGTFVNEKHVAKKVLYEDDEITIGKHTLLVCYKHHHGKVGDAKISTVDRTFRLETSRHKEMMKNQ